jgi:hypothetical protein
MLEGDTRDAASSMYKIFWLEFGDLDMTGLSLKRNRPQCSVGEPAEGSLQRTCPLGYISHPLFTIPLLLWQARLLTTGFKLVCACQRTQYSFIMSSEYYIIVKTFNNGSLGSGIDEERSEMR